MSTTDQWLPSEAAAEALHLSVSSLHNLKKAGLLKPGEHYYAAGTGLSGSLVWNTTATRLALLENTKLLAAAAKNKPAQQAEVCEEAF
jgi:hypothetical protein